MGRIDLRKKISLIVAATVVAGNLVFADTSKSCITDLKLNNDGKNINVNIYTDKPYSDSVVVSKKEGNKYVILVPETTSSVKNTSKLVGNANVSVSMQTVNAGKVYTKITIVSDKSVNIIPKTITAPKVVKPTVSSVSQSQKTEPLKPIKAKSIKPVERQTKSSVKKTQSVSKVSQKVQPVKPAPKVVEKPAPKLVQPPTSTNNVSRNKPLEILQKEVKSDKVADIKEIEADALLEKTIKDNDEIIKQRKLKKRKGKKTRPQIIDTKLSAKECIKIVLDEAKTLSLWKLLMLASAISFPIIVIMIIFALDKRINKRIKSINKEDDVVTVERVLRENVAAARAQKALEQAGDVSDESFDSFDEMLDKVEETNDIADSYEDSGLENVVEQSDVEVIDNSDFEIDDVVVPDVIEPDSTIIDDDTELGYDSFDEVETLQEEPSYETVPYNPDGVLADFSNVNDKDFFDELVLQSFAENDINNLPDNAPADEIFGVMTEDDSGILLSDFENTNSDQSSVAVVEPDDSADEDVMMLNEVKINDNTGLYLVNYDNNSSLVGHIADDYFVIKNFDGVVNSKIILKQAEKTATSERYLVRVGRNKMIVEVNDKTMCRLIDL